MADYIVEEALFGKVRDLAEGSSPLAKLNCCFFERVQKTSTVEDFDQNSKNCRSNDERLRLCSQYFPAANVLLSFFNTNNTEWGSDFSSDYRKNEEISFKFRSCGNEYFRSRNFTVALRAYNLALCFAPTGSSSVGLAYANRSAVFLEVSQLEFLEKCIEDISRAFSHDYPQEIRGKLEQRHRKCMERVANVQTNMHNDGGSCSEESIEVHNFRKNVLFQLQNPSEILPSAENFVKICSHPIRGRELIVTRDVSPGTTLLVEKPFTKILKNTLQWEFKHCHNCLKVVCAGVPCDGCVFAFFCTMTCKEQAMSRFHRYECPCWPYFHQLETPRFILLTLRLLAQLGPSQVCHLLKNPLELEKMDTDHNPKYDPSSYTPIFNLVSHAESQTEIEHFSNLMQTMILATFLEELTPFWSQVHDDVSPEAFRDHLRALILHHLQNLPCNSLALEEIKGHAENLGQVCRDAHSIRSAQLEQFASGVYPTISLINHSCDANVTRLTDSTNEGQMTIIALKGLKAGEPLFISYTKSFQDPLDERLEYLSANYRFECTCQACSQKWPPLTQLLTLDPQFRCGKCSQPIQKNGKCVSKCRQKLKMNQLLTEWNQNVTAFYSSYELVLQDRPLEVLQNLKPILAYFQNALVMPSGKFILAIETLKRALDLIVYF